jgi:hypothetical protein
MWSVTEGNTCLTEQIVVLRGDPHPSRPEGRATFPRGEGKMLVFLRFLKKLGMLTCFRL